MGGALGVGHEAPAEPAHHLGERLVELGPGGGGAGGSGGQQEDRVIGGHAAVGVDPVDGSRCGGRQGVLRLLRGENGISGDDGEHGGHPGGQHPNSLDHAADGPALCPGTDREGVLLGDGVGGHDGGGGVGPGLGRVGQGEGGDVDALQEDGHVDALPDDAGGADQDLARFGAQQTCGAGGGGFGVVHALRSGAGVGAAGVEDDGAGVARLHAFLTGQEPA